MIVQLAFICVTILQAALAKSGTSSIADIAPSNDAFGQIIALEAEHMSLLPPSRTPVLDTDTQLFSWRIDVSSSSATSRACDGIQRQLIRNVTQTSATLTLEAANRTAIVCKPKQSTDLSLLCGSDNDWSQFPTTYTATLAITMSYIDAASNTYAQATASTEGKFIRGMSRMNASAWGGAEWIGVADPLNMSSLFRTSYNINTDSISGVGGDRVSEAFLCVAGLGGHRATINARPLDPTAVRGSVTEWHNRTFYFTDDVTSDVKQAAANDGIIAISIELYKHWYGLSNKFYPVAYGARALKAVLVVNFVDGTSITVCPTSVQAKPGQQWWQGAGQTLHEDLHTGQTADGRLDIPGWQLPTYIPTSDQWNTPQTVQPPFGALRAHPMARSRVLNLVRPINVSKISGDDKSGPGVTYRFTLPHEVAGFCTLLLPKGCPAGTQARLRHGEAVNGVTDFLVPTECTKAFSPNHTGCENTSYICRGNGDGMSAHDSSWRRLVIAGNTTGRDDLGLEAFTPAFQFSAFRFIEVTYDGTTEMEPPTTSSMACYRIGVGFDWVGDVAVGSKLPSNDGKRNSNSTTSPAERFNTVVAATRWTAISNYLMDVPTDCPHREKRGWAGDSLAAHEALAAFFDMRAAWTKWVDDMVMMQSVLQPLGTMVSIIPCIFDTHLCRNDPRGGKPHDVYTDVAWGSVLPLLAAYTANLTGDARLADRFAPAAVAYVELLYSYTNNASSQFPRLLNASSWPSTSLGDWCSPAGGMSVSTLLNSHHMILDTDAAVSLLKSASSGQPQPSPTEQRLVQLSQEARSSFVKAFLSNATLQPGGSSTTCGSAPEHQNLTLFCGQGSIINDVTFAGYGVPNGTCDSGLQPSPSCFLDVSSEVKAACVGKASCSIECLPEPHERLCAGVNVSDPCAGVVKALSVAVTCQPPSPPNPTISGLAFTDPYPPATSHGRHNSKPSRQTESSSGMAAMRNAPNNLISGDQRIALGNFLAALVLNISTEQGATITGGVIDMNHLAPQLIEHGRPDAAFQLLSADGSPSYYNMAKYGGTLWENWFNADSCNTAEGCTFVGSLNHIMFGGSVGQSVFGIGGLRPLAINPQSVFIAPIPWLDGAPRGSSVWRSLVGLVSTSWSTSEASSNSYSLWINATVPAGASDATIEVMLPQSTQLQAVCAMECSCVDQVSPSFTSRWVSFDSGGGHYENQVVLPPPLMGTPPTGCFPIFSQGKAPQQLPAGVESVMWTPANPGFTMFPSLTLNTRSGRFSIFATRC